MLVVGLSNALAPVLDTAPHMHAGVGDSLDTECLGLECFKYWVLEVLHVMGDGAGRYQGIDISVRGFPMHCLLV